jgi:hypothetical protein
MFQTLVSPDGTRAILPNGFSRQLPHGPQGCLAWCFEPWPEGKIWTGCDGCQCDYTLSWSSCQECEEPAKVAKMPGWNIVIPVDEKKW